MGHAVRWSAEIWRRSEQNQALQKSAKYDVSTLTCRSERVKLSFKSVYSQQACFNMSSLYLCLDIRNTLYCVRPAILPPWILKMPRIQTMEYCQYSMLKILLILIHIRIWYVFDNHVWIVRDMAFTICPHLLCKIAPSWPWVLFNKKWNTGIK